MAGDGELERARKWTEECRVREHDRCEHVGSARTVGLLGLRRFVTLCPCACHWGCPADAAELSESKTMCNCSTNGAVRRQNFDAALRARAEKHRFRFG